MAFIDAQQKLNSEYSIQIIHYLFNQGVKVLDMDLILS